MTEEEIKSFQNEFTDISNSQIISLKKTFDFGDIPSSEIIRGLQVKKIGSIKDTNQFQLVLRTKDGFEINNVPNSELESELFTVNIDLIINSKESGSINLTEEEINSILETEQDINANILLIIKKVFDFPDAPNEIDDFIKRGLRVIKISNGEGKYILKLIANPGFLINELQELTSNEFMVHIKLSIKPKDTIEALTEEEINSITNEPQDIDAAKLAIVKKAFDTIATRNIDAHIMTGLKIQKISSTTINNTHQLKLIAKPGYLINDILGHLHSSEFIVNVNFKIVPKNNVTNIMLDEVKGFENEFTDISNSQIFSLNKIFSF